MPREGGNTVRGSFYGSGVTEKMVGSNYTAELEDRGLTTPGAYQQIWDFNVGVGGPMLPAKSWWFFGTFRNEGSHRTIPSMFANANAGDPGEVDLCERRVTAGRRCRVGFSNIALRLTAQVTPRNKVTFFWDEQMPCEGAVACRARR